MAAYHKQLYRLHGNDRERLTLLQRYLCIIVGQSVSYADVVHWLLEQVNWVEVKEKVGRRR